MNKEVVEVSINKLGSCALLLKKGRGGGTGGKQKNYRGSHIFM